MDYEKPKFEVEFDIGIEDVDLDEVVVDPDMEGKSKAFDSLLSVRKSGNDAGRDTQGNN